MANHLSDYEKMLEEVGCNLCGAEDYDVVYPPHYEKASSADIIEVFRASGDQILIDQLVRCKKCGFQYLNPRLRQNIIMESYSRGTDKNFVSQVAGRERTFARHLNLIEHFALRKGKILDIGTAAGSFLGVAKKRGWNVTGCEPNRWLAEWGSHHYNINIYPCTLFDMNIENSSIDVVTLWDVIEHVPNSKEVLNECRRILKPDGLLIVSYPDMGSLIARIMGRKWVFLLSVHLYYFTFKTMKEMLKLTGFEVVKKKKLWQTLELGYILFRMKAYMPLLANLAGKVTSILKINKVLVPYWMGQSLIIAKQSKNIT